MVFLVILDQGSEDFIRLRTADFFVLAHIGTLTQDIDP